MGDDAARDQWVEASWWKRSKSGTSIYHNTSDFFLVIIFEHRKYDPLKFMWEDLYGVIVKDLQRDDAMKAFDFEDHEEAKGGAYALIQELREIRTMPYLLSEPEAL